MLPFGRDDGRLRRPVAAALAKVPELRQVPVAKYWGPAKRAKTKWRGFDPRTAESLGADLVVLGSRVRHELTLRLVTLPARHERTLRLPIRDERLDSRDLRRVAALASSLLAAPAPEPIEAEASVPPEPSAEPPAEPAPRPAEPSVPPLEPAPVEPEPEPVVVADAAPVETPVLNLRAARREGDVQLDGVPDDDAWLAAPPFTAFHKTYPQGGAPTQRTEVRVLHDDRHLWVAVRCFDTEAERIISPMGRRDVLPSSDEVIVMLDTTGDRRSGYAFAVNAGGVLEDALLVGDSEFLNDWDAAYQAEVFVGPDGWSAELRIPFSALRFSDAPEQRWGINVRREIGRTHELSDSAPIDYTSNQLVSAFTPLEGLRDVRPQRRLEATPFAAARLAVQPRDASSPTPRVYNPSADLGLDFKLSLTSALMLNATVNPDFGDVRPDEVILNLTNVEVFLPERRPFFTQGTDLLQGAKPVDGDATQLLFYSRRVGLDVPILGAVKVSGAATPWLDVGLLDVVVAGAQSPASMPGTGVVYSPKRPLHLGLAQELPAERPVTRNFFAGVVRARPSDGVTLAARAALSTPVEGECALDAPPPCTPTGSQAVALEADVRTGDRAWGVVGQLVGSRATGGPSGGVRLDDGTTLVDGSLGLGGFVQAGRLGGEGIRAWAMYEHAAPTLALDQTGYLEANNQQRGTVRLGWTDESSLFFPYAVVLEGRTVWTADARGLALAHELEAFAEFTFESYDFLSLGSTLVAGRVDQRELAGSGLALQRADTWRSWFLFESDPGRFWAVELSGSVAVQPARRWAPIFGGRALARVRPHARVDVSLAVATDGTPDAPFFVDDLGEGRFLLADLDSRFLSVTAKGLLMLSPRLSLELYAQLFSSTGTYRGFMEGAGDGRGVVTQAALSPVEVDGPRGFETASLRVSAVLRWEYRLGSMLYLVYTRSGDGPELGAGQPPSRSLWPSRLGEGPARDTVLVKWAHAFGL